MPRQCINELFNCSASATDRIALEQLRKENKECDHHRRKKLSDRQRRQQRDRHRQFHGHTALEEIFPGLLIDRKSADHGSGERQPVTVHEWTPPAGQAGDDDDTHKSQPDIFTSPGFVMMVMAMVIMLVAVVRVVTAAMMLMIALVA